MEEACKSLKLVRFFYFFSAEFFLLTDFSSWEGFVPQISQIYTDFLHHDFSSSDFTDESEGILVYRITHGISRNFGRWPMARALYMLLLFFVTQISLMTQIFLRGRVLSHRFHRFTQIFFIMIFLHRISRINRRHSGLSDYSRNFAEFWPLANGLRPIYAPVVLVTQISLMTQIFLRGEGFVPQISQIYTDFYGISGESLCPISGVSATTGQVASAKIRE